MKLAMLSLLLSGMMPWTLAAEPGAADVKAQMQASFQARGQAGMDRLDQDAIQAACSNPEGASAEVTMGLADASRAAVKYPADGVYLGDWRRGEQIAQRGTGLQYSDNPGEPNGGNCYACHQLAPTEIAYGTIGPSLTGYGKNRGSSEAMLKLAWGMVYDMKGYVPCSNMPRFGARQILTEDQLRDVMALLFDPDSPVNQ